MKSDELWNKLQKDLLNDFPENYTANVKLIKDILTYKHIVHPSAVMSSYLTIISGLTAESFYTQFNSSTTLYTISIAGTGTGKDMATDIIPQIFGAIKKKAETKTTDIGFEIITSSMTSVGALDGVFKDKRMLIYVRDEFGDALGKMQGGGHAGELTAKFKELYSQTHKSYKSIVYARSNKNSSNNFTRDYPCFILTGLTTKEQLLSRLKRSMLHDGFLNRFIIMDGGDLKPYIDNDFKYIANNQFKDAIDFYEKVKSYPNTPISMSNEAKEFFISIGSPYEINSDINRFCVENEDEEFETNASTANRWRENAIRLATAITAYEYGVNNSKEDILRFQTKSFESRKDILKDSPLEEFNGREDLVKDAILKAKQEYENAPVGSYNPKKLDDIIEDYNSNKEFWNKIFNKAKADARTDKLKSLTDELFNIGDQNKINLSIETVKENLLFLALEKILEDTEPNNINQVVNHILKDKSQKAQDRINSVINKNNILTQQGKLTEYVPPVFIQKDILEWSYNFIKSQSIKFYEIFHTQVGQNQHTIKKNKLIKWFKDNYDEDNPWHTQSELVKTYVFNKLCTPKEREMILNDLIDSEIIETKMSPSKGTHKPTRLYALIES